MTTDEGTDSSAPAAAGGRDPHTLPDGTLRMLVDLVNRSGVIELGITLHMSGLLISGKLISGRSYFEAFKDEVTQSGGDDSEGSRTLRDGLGTLFAHLAEQYREREADSGADEELDDAARVEFENIAFIHLREATSMAAGGTYNLGMWRARLIDVSGWRLGVPTA